MLKIFMISLILQGTLMAIEEPKFTVIEKNDTFEIRKYSSYLVAETEVSGEFDEMGKKAFKILFKYISGENQERSEIAMTSPVIQKDQEQPSQKIKMTAPVIQEIDNNNTQSSTFSFVMPENFTLETLPIPLDKRINIKEIPERTIAVREYSGTWSQDRFNENKILLLEALKKAKIQTIGEASFARYNSPFSLWFLRRNEVMIEIE
ncbi:MAG: Heme-binding protein [uncultured Sulfurovum sp.]|uniref:Heme-binding protein n=1 Tax=uncultured Sulfurovum sp. TaxID=269237 RepID=A0A6S6RY70_9BACT|nr:MAG: Heme-binding protein [uncultured Sulfurovum sp.]